MHQRMGNAQAIVGKNPATAGHLRLPMLPGLAQIVPVDPHLAKIPTIRYLSA